MKGISTSDLSLHRRQSVHDCLNVTLRLVVCLAASGVLKGFDPLLNLVLDGTIEYMRGKSHTLHELCVHSLL